MQAGDSPFQGGLVQAILDATPAEERKTTFVWIDLFCVNQHLVSPFGGLLAFAFDLLRNAIIECDHVMMFLESWDDPGPLSRVWCLEEIRTALLLGKEVRICMPQRQADAFRKMGTRETIIREIDRVVSRIDIQHAAASIARDRDFVLGVVEESVGFEALNCFCKEIVRAALMKAGGVNDTDSTSPSLALEGLFKHLLAIGDDFTQKRCAASAQQLRWQDILREIEIRRAVAVMRLRLDSTQAKRYAPRRCI